MRTPRRAVRTRKHNTLVSSTGIFPLTGCPKSFGTDDLQLIAAFADRIRQGGAVGLRTGAEDLGKFGGRSVDRGKSQIRRDPFDRMNGIESGSLIAGSKGIRNPGIY